MGAVLAVVSQKGGVGKTTTAVNLAAAFARRGMKTLLIDVDPQGSVRYGSGLARGHEIILPTALPWLRVILAGSVADESDHAVYSQLVRETNVLQELLQMAEQRCQVVVVDTPPGLGSITRKVLGASEHVIVPLQCEPLALQTTPQILRAIQDIVAVNERLTLDGILLTMYEANNQASDRVVDYVRRHLPANIVFDVVIPRTVATADAFAAGQPVVVRSPADAASQAYVNLATLLADRLV
jgi:chromosome partitioning protein